MVGHGRRGPGRETRDRLETPHTCRLRGVAGQVETLDVVEREVPVISHACMFVPGLWDGQPPHRTDAVAHSSNRITLQHSGRWVSYSPWLVNAVAGCG